MSDSSAIDAALIALLASDATLSALCPDGVFWDEAPPGSTRFVIVSFVDEQDAHAFSGRVFEDGIYMVKAVMQSTANGDIKAAAARIDALLEQQRLTATGYSVTAMARESRIRITEVDEGDPTMRWFHRGGRYRVLAATS